MRLFFFISGLFFMFSADAQKLVSGGPLKPEQENADIKHYTIALDVDPDNQRISGYTDIDLELKKAAAIMLFDLADELPVSAVTVNGKSAEFTHSKNLITVQSKSAFPTGRQKIRISYAGKPAIAPRAPWVGGFQWEKDSGGKPWIAISCQGEGGKIYFPCKDHPSDEPDEGADMIITVPKGLVVAGPGLLQRTSNKGNKSTWHWKTNYPISNYCLVFNIGDYTVVKKEYVTVSNNRVPMEFYVLKEHADKAAYHLTLFENSARVLEKYFGEYPWVKEKMAIAETPHLGMEHQTMNAYGNKFRYTKVGGKDFDWLLHHEFGHEWWANKVTNRDWAHMWIQEGICSFGDAMYYREYEGEAGYLRHMQKMAIQTQNKFPIVQGEDGINSEKAYHSDIYGKGAFFMHTLRYIIGDEIFFPALKKLATDQAYTYLNTVTTDDVDKLFSTAYGKSLTPVFNLFLRTTNKLEVLVKQVDNNKFKVTLTNINLPLPLEIITDKGRTKITADSKGTEVTSATPPVIDPDMFYLKRVVFE